MTFFPFFFRNRIVSAIIAKFSFGVVRSTSFTCSSHVLPKRVTTGVLAAMSSLTCGSSLAAVFLRRVEPKAAIWVFLHLRLAACLKNSMSFGLLPGQPPST